MSPVVLLVLVTFASGAGAMAAIEMPSHEACISAQRQMLAEHSQDTSARCIQRIAPGIATRR